MFSLCSHNRSPSTKTVSVSNRVLERNAGLAVLRNLHEGGLTIGFKLALQKMAKNQGRDLLPFNRLRSSPTKPNGHSGNPASRKASTIRAKSSALRKCAQLNRHADKGIEIEIAR